jgi:chemotaxis signal transduction protein
VSFFAGALEVAIRSEAMVESVRWPNPMSLASPAGRATEVLNLRGNRVPILDLGEACGLGGCQSSSRSRIVVARVEGGLLGFRADRLGEIGVLDSWQADGPQAPPLPILGGFYLDQRPVWLLDLDRLWREIQDPTSL